jgi:CDP-glycerol glycerophosphotransferase (TagB/SpsB family)/glycosyltransferase involved in cell wall biosynthesis
MLASLLRQMLDFRACIQIVIVDTRSMEVASETERGWAERFPSNITYLRHENKSLAGARNAGMARATGDWITFIAPHDLLDADYFLNVDRALQAEKQADSLHLIACNRITFEEEGDTLTDADPLRYRFQYGRRRVVFDDTCADIEISVTAVFFNRQKLLETGLTFKELGTGEEFYFVAHYLLMAKEPEVLFLPEARYRCRQQADEPLPPDTKKNNPTWYSTLLRDIYLDLLKRAHAHPLGPPRWLQRAIVYELVWHFKRQFDDHRKASWVPAKLRPGYIELLQAILGRIDPAILASFELTDVTDLHRLAMLALADRTAERVSKVELIAFDKAQETVCLHYYYVGPQPELQVMMGADVASPTADKTRIHRFMFNPLVREYIGWFAWQGDGLLTLFINGKRVEQDLSLRAKEAVITRLNSSAVNPQYFSASVRLKRFLGQLPVLSHRFKKGWVLIDRDTQADDNAEHLYRYIRANHSQVNAWFVLRKTSHDWDRLKKEGFRLLAFGSLSHKLALLHAQHLISSHVEPYVTYLPPSNYNDLIQRDTTFLQHGVIKDDLSGWLNRKSLRHFATSAPKEYDSVCADETPYKFTEREMVLTGLPRHDRLIKKREAVAAKTVLIMPTWRSSLVSVATDAYGYSVKNAAFLQSTFYRTWSSFLNSPELRNLAAEYGYELVFFPHSELKAYVEDFKAEHVRIVGHSDVDSIQDLFLNAEIMITDYSSVAFEMAYLERPILYYQFDEDFVFNGGHIYEQGYFDYREDGFGPVCTDQTELLQELELILGNQGGAFEPYRQRMKDFFAFRDGRCCERVFELIAKG